MKLLHVNSSITGAQSVSRQLTASIVSRIAQEIPEIDIVYRDVATAPVPQHSEVLLAEKFQAQSAANVQPPVDLAAVNAVLEEFLEADIVVIGAPMYNFSVPSQLKSWIDCLAAPGRTFQYTANGAEGLCGGKRIIVASSRGGIYSQPSPAAGLDHQESYLSAFFAFIGIAGVEFVRAEGVAMGPEQRQQAIDSALAEVVRLPIAHTLAA